MTEPLLTVEIEGLEELSRRFEESPQIVEEESRRAMRVSLDVTQEQVAGRWPVFLGHGRDSTATEIRGTGANLRGFVGTPLIYGLPVEQGRKAGKMPPVDAIEYWVIRKQIAPAGEARGVAFLIARRIGAGTSRGIMRPGGGARMFEKGLKAATPSIHKSFDQAVKRVVERLGE